MKLSPLIKKLLNETLLDFKEALKLPQHKQQAQEKIKIFTEILTRDEITEEQKKFLQEHYTGLKEYNKGLPLWQCKQLVE